MVFRNKDPCQPCRSKKIRCIHNIQQIPSPAPVASPKATLTPRKTRQGIEEPSTINLGNIPVFENQEEGLDALATISSNNLGARDNTPDLLETCSTKPVVIPRKRRLFRESPPAKLTKKQKLDGSPTDTFEAEIKVSVPAWITEKLKTIPDFRNPMGSKRSGLKYCRKNLKTLFANTCDPEGSSNNSVQSAPTAELEKEESLRPSRASLDTNTSKAESSGATTSILMIDDDNPVPSMSEDPGHGLEIKGDVGALSLMSPSTPASIENKPEKSEVGNPLEVGRHYPLSVQPPQEELENPAKSGNVDSGMLQEVGSKLYESEPKKTGALSNGKSLEEEVNVPVEIEPRNPEMTQAVENEPYGCEPLSTDKPILMINGMVDGKFPAEGNDAEEGPVVTGLNEQGTENQEEEQCVVSNLDGSSSGGPGLRPIITSNDVTDGDVEHVPHLGNRDDSPLDTAEASEKNDLEDTAQKELVGVTKEEPAQDTLNFQHNTDESLDPDANIYLHNLAFSRYERPMAPIHLNGAALSPSPTPWNRTPADESSMSSDGSMDSDNTRLRLWSKEKPESPTLSTIDRSRWRDLDAGPSRFSGPRIVTPLRATSLEPGMGLVDTRRYSQHEGLWNMVTNDYLAKFKRISQEKEEEQL